MSQFISSQVLNRRRKSLGMSYKALSRRSGVSLPTVKRLLTRGIEHASFANVSALASALGMGLKLSEEASTQKLRESEALVRAKRIVSLVQGSSGLESQAVAEADLEDMVSQTFHELMALPKSRLWSDSVR